jgi:hypothetical protein
MEKEREKERERQKEKEHAKSNPSNSKADFENMVQYYLASNPLLMQNRKTSELEIRFGTNRKSS